MNLNTREIPLTNDMAVCRSTDMHCFVCGMNWFSTQNLDYCPRFTCRVRNIKGINNYRFNVTNTTNRRTIRSV